mmetsp:Transcript_18245/g.27013  ORF Transcript_18245/g.27013 Transcript_18245/m.27013 type:complete len:323 (+) Transcript_18245:100-1068(+)
MEISYDNVSAAGNCSRKKSSWRGCRDIHDPFFLKGYQLSWRDEGSAVIYCIEEGCIFQSIESTRGVANFITAGEDKEQCSPCSFDNENSIKKEKKYACGFPGCPLFFDSFTKCDLHYEESHMFLCDECDCIFPSERLLDLHLQEAHDNFFATALKRHQAQFQCLVCSEAFHSKKSRQTHLIESHKYPKWFRFTSNAAVDGSTWKKKQKWLQHHDLCKGKQLVSEMDTDGRTTAAESNAVMSLSYQTHKEENRAKRRERQSQQRARTPCKFHMTKSGCWRGSKCMFLHTLKETTVDDLSLQLQNKAKVTVPDKISFGRRRRYL